VNHRYRNPLSVARGLGSSKDGLGHWWKQRLTSIALMPLVLWFVVSMIALAGQNRAHVLNWLHSPLHGLVFSLFLIVSLYHANLGLQKIYEDYVQVRWLQLSSRIATNFAAVLLAFAGVFALLRQAFGG
jgi:succinate dehydrogenase / fumarate reductase membrane anchor subunit